MGRRVIVGVDRKVSVMVTTYGSTLVDKVGKTSFGKVVGPQVGRWGKTTRLGRKVGAQIWLGGWDLTYREGGSTSSFARV